LHYNITETLLGERHIYIKMQSISWICQWVVWLLKTIGLMKGDFQRR